MSQYDVIYLQRFIPSYRVSLFKRLTINNKNKSVVIYGNNVQNSKVKNSENLKNVEVKKLKMISFSIFGRMLYYQFGLLSYFKHNSPKIIVCEAESHFLGYIIAIFYKVFYNHKTKLILWCFYRLPGNSKERTIFHYLIKKIIRFFFSGFISYSTFGKNFLISEGENYKNIAVAVNVCDTDYFLNIVNKLELNKIDAKSLINQNKKFIISYVGSLEKSKKPDLILNIASQLDPNKFHFNIIGKGSLFLDIKKKIKSKNINNVDIHGYIGEKLPIYYRASDLIIIPGRGGIVISEAMCFGTPVIVHQADGVEHDLINNNVTGFIVSKGSTNDFCEVIRHVSENKSALEKISFNAKKLIYNFFNSKTMANKINKFIDGYMKNE